MLVNRTKIIVMTVIATLLYLLIMNAVDTTPFMNPLFDGADWTGAADDAGNNGTWLAWLGLILIPALGLYSAYTLGDKEIDVQADRDVHTDGQVSDPAWWKAVTGNTWLSVIWLPLRFALGIHWLQAGWHKTQEAGWAMSGTNAEGEFAERGSSMAGFLSRAYTPNPDTGRVSVVFGAEGWYADVLKFLVDNNWTSWMGPLVAWGEFLIGLGLLVGGLVGIAAFFGTLLNMSFMLAGTVSSNPWMFALTVFIILGWKVAGHYGLDRYLLPALGTPWGRRKQDDHVPTAGTGADQYAARV